MRLSMPVLLCASMAAGCARPAAPLRNTFETPAALAAAVLDALAQGNVAVLQDLAVSETEFRERVWPELPASNPRRNLPVEYVWEDLRQKSQAYLRQTLAEHRGRRYRLVRVEFLGESTRYRTLTVARKAQLIVRDEHGEESAVRLFGSVLESEAEYKLLSYVVD